MDLQEDRSFVRNLVEAGCQVYVLDWGHPTPADRYDDFGDLVNLYIDSFVDEICKREGIEQINLLGICQGGVLSMLYAALHPTKVRNLVTLVTPVDFHADQTDGRPDQGFMNVWARSLTHEDIDSLIDALGNIPGEVGGAMFSMMTPVRSLAKYNLTLLEVGQDRGKTPEFLAHGEMARGSSRPSGRSRPPMVEGSLSRQQACEGRACRRGSQGRSQEFDNARAKYFQRTRIISFHHLRAARCAKRSARMTIRNRR